MVNAPDTAAPNTGAPDPGAAPVLDVSGLRVEVGGRRVVDCLDLVLRAGEATALVGRSGSGKSLTARALAGLLPEGAARSGSARFTSGDGAGADLLSLPPGRMRALRGPGIGYAFQEAQASLNPTVPVGAHLQETLKAHGVARDRRRARGLAALRGAGLEAPERLWRAYPFELSGGQAQRVALALACVLDPRLLIADEITSALDPLTQAGVLDTLRARTAAGGSLLLITHDLAVAARWADRVAVLDGGRIAESGPAEEVLRSPRHPFTRELVRAAEPGGRVGAHPASAGSAPGAPAAAAARTAGGAR
ncbi:ATP-binding cassette domain-containing protein [Nocardiopsis chromatogenes]|uniref:ATP-binding cassette domain-containing protein n=1 Tax=Nocardiopsis chromatogenes TaxID=280239 RepID=UPI0003640001|nr:ABC transporter ATP-binding protein [Nocardiopsis chromatogenes]